MNINQYLDAVNKLYQSGMSSEHAYRPDFRDLINELVSEITITNEPSNVTDCGNPDYVITKGKIPVGFIEAKDVGKDLNSKQYKEQFGRYRKALDNLIITDYIWFQFFQNGELIHEIRIAEISGNKIEPIADNHDEFIDLLKDFCSYVSQTIKSPKRLAELMAAKARLLENILEKAITSDEETEDNSALQQQYKTFKNILIHDLTPQGFADIYSQTLAYGMFAARLHDDTLEDFSRQEAAELIPKTNPFLRKLFNHVAGLDIDERIKTTVDNLADVFRATNVEELLKSFGGSTLTQDPIIHFYETFLAEYDPNLRKARGVWYTPEPVVSFIVRGIDELLKSEFNLKDGLVDTSKVTIQEESHKLDARTKTGRKKIEKRVHKVQILDPATGTGTFLAEVVKFIYSEKFSSMKGMWTKYVDENLIPRLNGFELLMASYSMAHLKLDMLLTETGYKSKSNNRFNIYLTNSLEEHHPDTGTLFSSWLSTEANEANHIKRDTPVMVVMGNPPYSVSSTNKSDWIEGLMQNYKNGLKEQNIQPLSDDYLKFIRYGQYLIDKNEEGILGFITNNSFITGNIHRQVRNSLLSTFDSIYVIDLHGNSNKKETTLTGGKDENVFDIRQGVSITFFIKNKNIRKKGVFQTDVFGERSYKYSFLKENSLESIKWNTVEFEGDNNYFFNLDSEHDDTYKEYFPINQLFPVHGRGVSFRKENLLVKNNFTLEDAINMVEDVNNLPENIVLEKYKLKETKDWFLSDKKVFFKDAKREDFKEVLYRPFDTRYTYYPVGLIHNIIVRGDHKRDLMKNVLANNNISLICPKQSLEGLGCFLTTKITENKIVSAYNPNYIFPLYLTNNDQKDIINSELIKPNIDLDIVSKFEKKLQMAFNTENVNNKTSFSGIDIIDYIYAIFHSPTYRTKYKEYLKVDFPRIPYPKDKNTFWSLVKFGGELRQLHLLETNLDEKLISTYPNDGNNLITRKINKNDWELFNPENGLGRIWINDEQCFENIPLIAWEFFIGGYQPAQKWLKDRKERELSFDDISHYQKIIASLMETDRIMKEIDKIDFE